MQKDRDVVVGLDIGSTKISVVVGCQDDFGNLEILGMGNAPSEGVIRGLVTNIDKTVNGIQRAIAEAEAQSNINIRVVNVGIAGQHIKCLRQHGSITRESSDREISAEDIARLTNDMYRIVIPPGSEIIHVIPQDYTVDYEEGIRDPVGMSGVKLEADFHLITAQTNAISNIHKCIRRANLELHALMLEPIASSLAVLTDEEREAGVALVDIGGGTTDVAVYYDNIIRHTAVVPFGGSILTSDIKQGCMIMQNQAEALKVKFGKALSQEASANEVVSIPGLKNRPPKEISVKNLAYIIEARMEEIVEMVYAEIVRSGYENRLAGEWSSPVAGLSWLPPRNCLNCSPAWTFALATPTNTWVRAGWKPPKVRCLPRPLVWCWPASGIRTRPTARKTRWPTNRRRPTPLPRPKSPKPSRGRTSCAGSSTKQKSFW